MKGDRVFLVLAAALGVLLLAGCQQASFPFDATAKSMSGGSKDGGAGNGVDEFGYNYTARLFVGAADGVDRVLDGAVWGDPTYANDHLVMKWSKAWDDARFHGADWGPGAWEDNEWNGMAAGGSGEVWHYKIVWVGAELQDSPHWREGGYAIWNQFEVIFSQGVADGEHSWEAHTLPSGYGPM